MLRIGISFESNSFDGVVNECAVGIPDDSQAVLNEMVRVAKPGGTKPRIHLEKAAQKSELLISSFRAIHSIDAHGETCFCLTNDLA